MSSGVALPSSPSSSSSSVQNGTGAGSATTADTVPSSTISSRGTAGASPPLPASTASSVFSSLTWWPPFNTGTAAPATVTAGGAMATMAGPGGASGGQQQQQQQQAPMPASVRGNSDVAAPRPRQLNATLPSLRASGNTTGGNNGHGTQSSDRNNVAEARAALEASMANILDRELVPRAQALHAGERVITRQQADVARATASLRQTNRQLERLVEDTSWKLRELGHLQNWTEMMERRFLVVEETLRLKNEGGGGGDDDASSCSSCRCSECCSDCGRSTLEGSEAGQEPADLNASATGSNSRIDAERFTQLSMRDEGGTSGRADGRHVEAPSSLQTGVVEAAGTNTATGPTITPEKDVTVATGQAGDAV